MPRSVLVFSLAIGALAALRYYELGLTLSHYDAKAHLVVARRILDSLSPGWVQIGAVWLPLPHLLNLLPVQFDSQYRSGFSAVAISWAAFGLGCRSLWWLVARATGSTAGAWAALAVFAAQPDVLYLQATPMTEPLLMGLSLFAIAHLYHWVDRGGTGIVWPGGVAMALACLTRYEAWPIAGAGIVLTAAALARRGVPSRLVARRTGVLTLYPLTAIVAFLFLSHATVGAWLVTDGFFQVDAVSWHHPMVALGRVAWGFVSLNGLVMTAMGVIACVAVARAVLRSRRAAALLLVFALAACAALPCYAFWKGHPYRIRYMVPLTMSLAATIGVAVGLLPRYRRRVAALVILTAFIETPPLPEASPMLLEAQWDRPRSVERQSVAACLRRDYDGSLIVASMGSIAHFMQELWVEDRLPLRAFIHEGNGRLWTDSIAHAGSHAGWLLMDERGEGGDVLARRRQTAPGFLDGFIRTCEGGGVALYRRIATP